MNNKRAIYINGLRSNPQGFLQYMNQFVEAGERAGFRPLKVYASPKHLFRRVMPFLFYLVNLLRLDRLRSKPLIITSRGDGILEAAFPYYLSYHIIPMLWDTWPKEQDWLFKDLRQLKCTLALVSSRQMSIRIEKELGIKTLWVPEGINIQGFSKGKNLALREIDIYELGRQHKHYHMMLKEAVGNKDIGIWKGNIYDDDGTLRKLACDTTEELKDTLANSKLVVCFPKVDTNKQEESGGIETLTQRYWEVMLSRSIPIGRAPKELIDLIGYNPVIEVDWNNPRLQVLEILDHIAIYQPLVDKNYATACKIASWDCRMKTIKEFIYNNIH